MNTETRTCSCCGEKYELVPTLIVYLQRAINLLEKGDLEGAMEQVVEVCAQLDDELEGASTGGHRDN